MVQSARAVGLVLASTALIRLRFRNPLVAGLLLGLTMGIPLITLGLSDSPVRFPPERRGIHNEDRDAREAQEVRPGVP